MSKVRVGIIFGGRSAEHEVSLQSARNIVDALDRARFEPVLIGIDKAGHWHLNDTSNFCPTSSRTICRVHNPKSNPYCRGFLPLIQPKT